MSKVRHGPFWWFCVKAAQVPVNTSLLCLPNPLGSTVSFGPFKTVEDASAHALAWMPKNGYKVDHYQYVVAEAAHIARPLPPPPLEFIPLGNTDEEE